MKRRVPPLRRAIAVFVAAWMFVACAELRAQEQPVSAPETADVWLGRRFYRLAREALRDWPATAPEQWRRSAVLLQAAARCDSSEPRYPLMRSKALAYVGDAAGAAPALGEYRRLVPDDQVAQVGQIDLYLATMSSAQARLKYLDGALAAGERVPAEVRSHAAMRAAQIHLERNDRQAAIKRLDEALALSPLNLSARRLALELSPPRTAPQHLAALLDMLRANPPQADVLATVGKLLADAGLGEASIEWYAASTRVYQKSAQPLPLAVAIDYTAQLLVYGRAEEASALSDELSRSYPKDMDLLLLRISAAEAEGDADRLAKRIGEARQLLEARLSPATLPATAPASTNESDGAFRAAAAADLGWIAVSYEGNAAEGRRLAELVRPFDADVAARLEGWAHVVEGHPQEVEAALAPLAERDPLAMLAMLKIHWDEAAARRLMAENGSGLLGAILAVSLRDRGITPERGAGADALEAGLKEFDTTLLSFVERPGDFYEVVVEPAEPQAPVDEPAMVRVTLRNVGRHDLTIGAEGAISSDLWLDAMIRGDAPRRLAGAGFDNLRGRLVLSPGESMTQLIAVDHPQLAGLPEGAKFGVEVMTNPVASGGGGVQPGPGGMATTSRGDFSIIAPKAAGAESAWTRFEAVRSAPGDQAEAAAATMLKSEDWRERLLALVALTPRLPAGVDPAAEADPTVRAYLQTLGRLPATGPATSVTQN